MSWCGDIEISYLNYAYNLRIAPASLQLDVSHSGEDLIDECSSLKQRAVLVFRTV